MWMDEYRTDEFSSEYATPYKEKSVSNRFGHKEIK